MYTAHEHTSPPRNTVALRDAFGRLYTVRVLSRREVEQIIKEMDWADQERMAYAAAIPGYGPGIVYLDVTTGKTEVHQLSRNESLIHAAHMITLATVRDDAKSTSPYEPADVLDDHEHEELGPLPEDAEWEAVETFLEARGETLQQRLTDMHVFGAVEARSEYPDEYAQKITEQLDAIYSGEQAW